MNQDFKEFFASLNALNVEFLVIGGVAYNFYASPRATKDIDIWVGPARDNLERLVKAIAAFGFPVSDLDVNDLATNQRVLMLGRVPNRIDILTRPDGVEWEPAWQRREPGHYGDVMVHYLGAADLIASKRASGRPRDLADVAMLEDIQRRRGSQ